MGHIDLLLGHYMTYPCPVSCVQKDEKIKAKTLHANLGFFSHLTWPHGKTTDFNSVKSIIPLFKWILYMKIPFPGPIHVNSWKNLDLSIITTQRCALIAPYLLEYASMIKLQNGGNPTNIRNVMSWHCHTLCCMIQNIPDWSTL